MRRPRTLRLALELLAEAGLPVAAVIEGHRHTTIKLTTGQMLLLSRGANQTVHQEFLLKRDVGRLVRRGALS